MSEHPAMQSAFRWALTVIPKTFSVPDNPRPSRTAGSSLWFLMGTCLMICLFMSCKASPIAREKRWFDAMFDSTYHVYLRANGGEGLTGESEDLGTAGRRLGAWLSQGLKEEARDQKELERLAKAAYAGGLTITTEYDESGTEECLERLHVQQLLRFDHLRLDPPDQTSPLGRQHAEDDERLLKEARAKRAAFVQNLKDHKEEMREKGWRQYLVDRKFSQ